MLNYASPESYSVVRLAARNELDRGGTTLWRHAGNGFTVIVYQLHDEPEGAVASIEGYDMVELRVVSARTDLKNFWTRNVKRVTHKKWSWGLVCMDPGKSLADIQKDLRGKGYPYEYLTFDDYENLTDKAEKVANKVVAELKKLRHAISDTHKPWAKALKLDKGGDKDRFWVVAVFPDDFQWVVKIDYGITRNFGRIYPRYWEIGQRFDSFKRADAHAKIKLKERYDKNYMDDTTPETAKLLRWSLRAAIIDADGVS